jgi:hypothetical protein
LDTRASFSLHHLLPPLFVTFILRNSPTPLMLFFILYQFFGFLRIS